jgi:hypothetical protein
MFSLVKAQSKIAIFDPDGNVDSNIKTVIREEVSNVIVNNDRDYIVLERANIDKLLEESKFQGNYSTESQISELGKMMGAKYVCIITVVQDGNVYTIFCKQVDVETAIVEKQGEGKAFSGAEIPFASKEAAMKFALNTDVARREIERKRNELEKSRAEQARQRGKIIAAEEKEAKRNANKNNYNYISWGIGNGITYGKVIGMGIAGRHGGIFGVGYEVGIGTGRADELYYLHWSAGLRIYPYKAIFFSANYGILGGEFVESSNSDDGHFVMNGNKLVKGGSVLAGVNIKFAHSALTIAGGLSYPGLDFKQKNAHEWDKGILAWNVAYSTTF